MAFVITDELRSVCIVHVRTATFQLDPPDAFQIARARGHGSPPTEIIATIRSSLETWTDYYPFPLRATYWVRGRTKASPEEWGDWVGPLNSPEPTNPLRSNLDSPNNVLELRVTSPDPTGWSGGGELSKPAAVELAHHLRYRISGANVPLELQVRFRAMQTITTSDDLRVGFRWYSRGGAVLDEVYAEATLDLVDAQANAGVLIATAIRHPPGAYDVSLFMEIRGSTDDTMQVRIEDVQLFRIDPDTETGWQYIQVPDIYDVTPDTRPVDSDQTIFTHDGVGWSFLVSGPQPSQTPHPYRSTSIPDDEVVFLTNGPAVDIKVYAAETDTVLSIERFVDSALGKDTTKSDPSLWEPISSGVLGFHSPAEPSSIEEVFGDNLCLNPGAEANVDGWTTDMGASQIHITLPPTNAPRTRTDEEVHNGLINNLSTPLLSRTTSSPITGTGSFLLNPEIIWDGASYVFNGPVFKAGHRYKASVKIASIGPNADLIIYFGSSTPTYFPKDDAFAGGLGYPNHDRVEFYIDDPSTSSVTYTLEWVPTRDTSTAYFAIVYAQTPHILDSQIKFDDVEVREFVGWKIPAQPDDFTPYTIKLPGLFSVRYPTPYRVSLVSGTFRPYGVTRDPSNNISLVQDFWTVLRSMGEIRNQAGGELEFRPDASPPTVYHHRRRGRDHSKIEGGVDLRYGKNIIARRRSQDVTHLTNRLIVVGYGDDRTRLVHEVRALKDAQGRLPTHPNYLRDKNGVHRDTVLVTNPIINSSFEEPMSLPWINHWIADSPGVVDVLNEDRWNTSEWSASGSLSWRANADLLVTTGLIIWTYGRNDVFDLPVTEGDVVSASINVWLVTHPGGTTVLRFNFYDNDGLLIGSVIDGPALPTTPGYYILKNENKTAPANSKTMTIQLRTSASVVGNDADLYFDSLILGPGPTAPEYFDGTDYGCRFTGGIHDSPSEKLAKAVDWDAETGGTSEDAYGPRYGRYLDPQFTTTYQAQTIGQEIVELSAWPVETYEVEIADLSEIPKVIEPGDYVLLRYGGIDLKRRVVEATSVLEKPNVLQLVLGSPQDALPNPINRVTRDFETALSALNNESTTDTGG